MPSDAFPWINPIGGFGDMLMVSGVLKQAHDADPSRRFHLIRRTGYLSILKGHPAIAEVGFPPKDAKIQDVTYWSMEELGPGIQRPYQILARAFGLRTPIQERLYLPGESEIDPMLHQVIPWKKQNILIAPASDSPRKMIHPSIWHQLVEYLKADDILVIQVGRLHEQHIRNAYSLLGLTTPRQVMALLKKCDLVITPDNFIMHAAHLTGVKVVSIWGPTNHDVYGYPEQIHIQMPRMCGLPENEDCIGVGKNKGARVYVTPCPFGGSHCMDQVKPEVIYNFVKMNLSKKSETN